MKILIGCTVKLDSYSRPSLKGGMLQYSLTTNRGGKLWGSEHTRFIPSSTVRFLVSCCILRSKRKSFSMTIDCHVRSRWMSSLSSRMVSETVLLKISNKSIVGEKKKTWIVTGCMTLTYQTIPSLSMFMMVRNVGSMCRNMKHQRLSRKPKQS